MDVSLLGLTPTVPLSAEYLREVTGPSTVVMRNPDDVGSGSIENLISGANMAETPASGLQIPRDGHHPKESTARSRCERSKSPHGRTGHELSPKSRTTELRARMARVQQMKMTQYLPPAPQLPPPPVFASHDMVTRAEAGVALGELQQQIGDATQCTDVLLQAVAETHQKAQEVGRIALCRALLVWPRQMQGWRRWWLELRNELHQMRTKIEGAEERANTAQRIADSAEQRANNAQYAADAAEQRAVAAQSDADVAKAKQELLEQELRNADLAFQEERKIRTR